MNRLQAEKDKARKAKEAEDGWKDRCNRRESKRQDSRAESKKALPKRVDSNPVKKTTDDDEIIELVDDDEIIELVEDEGDENIDLTIDVDETAIRKNARKL